MSVPEKPITVNEATESLQVRLDELMAPIHFQELLEVAEDVCLTHTPNYPETVDATDEARLVSAFGTRAIKAALELSKVFVVMDSDDKEYEDEQKRPIMLDTPMRLPDRFSRSVDLSILAKAEAFGAQLMDESFHVLGHDAHTKADAFREATTKQEQLEIIKWLDKRLYRLTHESVDLDGKPREDDEETEENIIYHPVRLSPKMTGTYPNNVLTPTCLGVSIIAAGFFKRAGAEMLHADVSRRGIEQDQVHAFHFINTLKEELGTKFGIMVPEAIQTSMDKLSTQMVEGFTHTQAHHAAVYVRLIDNSWAQFDSNFISSVEIEHPQATKSLTKSYDTLKEASIYAPGVEITSYLPDYLAPGEIMQEIFDLQDPSAVTTLMLHTLIEIEDNDPEAFGQRIFDNCISPFFSSTNKEDRLGLMTKIFKSEQYYVEDQPITKHIERAFHKMFEKYVLWGESPEMVVERMSKDEQYRLNRVVDITALPFIMMASAATFAANGNGFFRPHSLIETGLPEQRIGLAVLSDFAAYTESPLPASFWMSHWPGNVSVLENIEGASRSNSEDSHVYNNVVYRNYHPLTSRQNYGIIQSFISSRQQIKENEDGSGQE